VQSATGEVEEEVSSGPKANTVNRDVVLPIRGMLVAACSGRNLCCLAPVSSRGTWLLSGWEPTLAARLGGQASAADERRRAAISGGTEL
jgi:hypothetical protein